MTAITDFHAKYYAYDLTIKYANSSINRLSQSLFDATVDLRPHHLQKLMNQGVILADEVDLNKTIEAGLLVSQYWAENKLKEAKRNERLSSTVADKLNWQSEIKKLEKAKCKVRLDIDDAEDEIEEKRDQMIADLKIQLESTVEVEELFRIGWRVI